MYKIYTYIYMYTYHIYIEGDAFLVGVYMFVLLFL